MDDIKILFYEGYKGQETPRAIIIGDKEFKIQKILWRKRIKDHHTGKTYRVFKCFLREKWVKIILDEKGKVDLTFLEK